MFFIILSCVDTRGAARLEELVSNVSVTLTKQQARYDGNWHRISGHKKMANPCGLARWSVEKFVDAGKHVAQ